MLRQPFFNKEYDPEQKAKIDKQIEDVEKREAEISKAKKSILELDKQCEAMRKKIEDSKRKKTELSKDIEKIEAHKDNPFSADEIMNNMRKEFPIKFEQMMKDLEFQGKDPAWYQDSLINKTKKNDETSMRQEILEL